MNAPATITAPEILQRALEVFEERGQQRDQPNGERSIPAVVKAFAILTGIEMTDQQGWLFMALVKIKRSQSGKADADHYIDGANYFALAGESALQQTRWPVKSIFSNPDAPPAALLREVRELANAGMRMPAPSARACRICNGAGVVSNEQHRIGYTAKCHRCDGSGIEHWQRCPTCEGLGNTGIDLHGPIECTRCHGKGELRCEA